ncbi:hypothetical protein BDV19DRAFT_378619 [Aspergillus venezuelensis]
MLRPQALIPLAALVLGMNAALEVLHHVTFTRVLSPDSKPILNLIRYLLILGVIALAYAFKGMTSGFKKTTPWANMSGKWTISSKSVLLDYVNNLEIIATFTSQKRKHWAVTIGLISTLLSRTLVPFANSPAYVELFTPRNPTATFIQSSPYTQAISSQLGTSPPAVSTKENYTFDQFTFPGLPNTTVTAEVNAISATLLKYGYVANAEGLEAAGCTQSHTLSGSNLTHLSAWLNVTQCSDQDDNPSVLVNCHNGLDNLSVTGFICLPQFTSQRVMLSVNSTNFETTAFSGISEPQPLDILTSTEALLIYLQNPLDSDVQDAFGRVVQSVEVISMSARADASNDLEGTITVADSRILLTAFALRTLEALLAVMGILAIAFTIGLSQDPGPLAAAAVILSASDPNTKRRMAKQATVSAESMAAHIYDTRFTLQKVGDEIGVSMDLRSPPDNMEKTNEVSKGYRPLPLHTASKIALQVAFAVVMIGHGIMLWRSNRSNGICVYTQVSSAGLTLAASTVLVLLEYCSAGVPLIDDLSCHGRLLGSGSRRISIALLASAMYMLVVPAMKLVAAILFSLVDTQTMNHVNIQLDTSITANLESTFKYSNPDRMHKRACDFAEWERVPNFDLRFRTGIIGNLVLSNMLSMDSEKQDTSRRLVEARVPAIATVYFTWYCATGLCHQAQNTSSIWGIDTSEYARSNLTVPSYAGAATKKGYSGATHVDRIADFSSLRGIPYLSTAMSDIPDGETTWATPGPLNVSLPKVVDANATFIRPTEATIGSSTEPLPWRPLSVDTYSITYKSAYPPAQPYYFQPPSLQVTQYTANDEQADGRLEGNSLWSIRGSSQNFFELLAADAEYRISNLSRLLDPAGLADSAQQIYTAYLVQLLTELHPLAADTSPSAATNQTVPATLTYPQPRVRQDPGVTCALELLLFVLGCFAALVFYHFPSKAILPRAPCTLVDPMREGHETSGTNKVKQVMKVDIGTGVVLQSWKAPPVTSAVRSLTPVPAPTLPDFDFGHESDETLLPMAESRRSSMSPSIYSSASIPSMDIDQNGTRRGSHSSLDV